MMEVNPLSIILVKSDSKGDRLLFRYPYEIEPTSDNHDQRNGKKNPYALNIIEDLLQTPMPHTSNIHKGQLTGFTDEVLSTLFAVKPELCHRKFELKVNDVRFVGHPTLLPFRANKDEGTSCTILINIVFALQAVASHSVVKCYYDLSERLGKALRHEEKRCTYLSDEMKIMIAIHEELSSMDSDGEDAAGDVHNIDSFVPPSSPPRSPFHHILQKSSLAQSLKEVFEDLSGSGVVQVRMNQWVLVSFCLPHKAHQFHNRGLIIEPETIDRCLRSLRPYHGMLLLVDPNDLLNSIPLDSNPSLIRLVTLYSPLKSLQTLAIEADLPLSQVFQMTGHLVYWAKATIIYPLCESNVYVIAPDAQVHLNSPFVEKFAIDFPGLCLIQVMSMLSLPAPLWFHARAWSGGAALLAKCIVWMLQRHLLLQLHTYVQFLPTPAGPPINGTKDYYCEKHNGPRATISDSLVSLNLLPQTTPMTPSDDSSNDSFSMRQRDFTDSGFRSNKLSLYGNDSSLSDHERDQIVRNKNSFNLKNLPKSPVTKTKPDNPKNVFRENSLIFGDITGESSAESNPPTPHSVDSVDNCVKMKICDVKIRKDSENTDSSEGRKPRKNEWHLDSSESSLNSGDHIGVDIPDFCRTINIESRLSNGSSDVKCLDEVHAENNNNVENLTTGIANGVHNLKIEEKYINGLHVTVDNINSEKDKMNTSNSSPGSNVSERKVSNLKNIDTSFQSPTVVSNLNHNCDVVDSLSRNSSGVLSNGGTEQFTGEMLLADFTEEEKTALFKIPAAHNPEDLNLMATLYKKGYFRGEQHLEEIMFMENLTRSQVLQLLDKFRDVLVTYETEDPAIALLYSTP